MKNRYYVNPNAENVCNVVSIVFLVVSIICAFISLSAGFAADGVVYGILGAVICIIVGVVSWASLKVIVNISRSLYNINDAIRAGLIQNGVSSTTVKNESNNQTQNNSTVEKELNTRFSVGQLVIVKATEDQFRITSIDDKGYYSEKFDKTYSEDEIEDFDIYWDSNK